MKTLLFTLEYPPFLGGVANYYKNLVQYWPQPSQIFVLNNNENKLICPKLPFLKWLPAFFALWKNIYKNKINHILVGHILPLGTVTYLISKFLKIEYSVILHGMDFSFATKTKRKKILTKLILKNSQHIICANNYTANLVKEFLGDASKKITVVNPGISQQSKIKNKEFKINLFNKHNLKNKFVILTVCRFVKRKGVDMVLKSLPQVLKKIKDKNFNNKSVRSVSSDENQWSNLKYIILGSGEEIKNYKTQIKNLKLDKNVIIISNASEEEKNTFYDLSDIFVMPARNIRTQRQNNSHTCITSSCHLYLKNPSTYLDTFQNFSKKSNINLCAKCKSYFTAESYGDFEGFGIVYLEANLHKLPVIAGDAGGVRDAVVDGVNGLLVDPNSINDIGDKIIELAQNKNLKNKLGEQGYTRAIKDFNWRNKVKDIYNLTKV